MQSAYSLHSMLICLSFGMHIWRIARAVFRIQYVDLVQQIFVESINDKNDQFLRVGNPNQFWIMEESNGKH